MYGQVLLRNTHRLGDAQARAVLQSPESLPEAVPVPSHDPVQVPVPEPGPMLPAKGFSLTKLGRAADIALVSALALLLVFVVIWLLVGWGPRSGPKSNASGPTSAPP